MTNPAGKSGGETSQAQFRTSVDAPVMRIGVTSDAGLLGYRELDDTLGLSAMAGETLADAGADREWSRTTLKEKLIKIGAKAIGRARLIRWPDGGGSHSTRPVRGHFAGDRRISATATMSTAQCVCCRELEQNQARSVPR